MRKISLCGILVVTAFGSIALNSQAYDGWLPKCKYQVCANLDGDTYALCEEREETQIPLVDQDSNTACDCDCVARYERELV